MDLTDLLIPRTSELPNQQRWGWGTMTQISPPRVRMDGDTIALSATPTSLTGPLKVGQRVWVQLYGHRLIIMGTPDADTNRPYWRGYVNGAQSKPSGSNQNISWTLDYEWDGGTNTVGVSSIRQIVQDGEYEVHARVTWQPVNTTGSRSADLRLNTTGSDMTTGTTLDRDQQPPSGTTIVSLHPYWRGNLVAGDTLAISCIQTSGSNLDIVGTKYQGWFQIACLGPLRA